MAKYYAVKIEHKSNFEIEFGLMNCTYTHIYISPYTRLAARVCIRDIVVEKCVLLVKMRISIGREINSYIMERAETKQIHSHNKFTYFNALSCAATVAPPQSLNLKDFIYMYICLLKHMRVIVFDVYIFCTYMLHIIIIYITFYMIYVYLYVKIHTC